MEIVLDEDTLLLMFYQNGQSLLVAEVISDDIIASGEAAMQFFNTQKSYCDEEDSKQQDYSNLIDY